MHAFLLHLPGWGDRRVAGFPRLEQIIPALHQAISDVRRARDAVAALPPVDRSVVGLQGTSLGGFVTATVAGLDHGYDRVFIFLAGGNLDDVFFNGSKELAKARAKLAAAGVADDQIKEVAHEMEPLRLAHRMNPAQTWLFNGKYDTVVPPSCSLRWPKQPTFQTAITLKYRPTTTRESCICRRSSSRSRSTCTNGTNRRPRPLARRPGQSEHERLITVSAHVGGEPALVEIRVLSRYQQFAERLLAR